jgi:hypothetical protein
MGFKGYKEWIIQLNRKNYKLYVKLKKKGGDEGFFFLKSFSKRFFLSEKGRMG